LPRALKRPRNFTARAPRPRNSNRPSAPILTGRPGRPTRNATPPHSSRIRTRELLGTNQRPLFETRSSTRCPHNHGAATYRPRPTGVTAEVDPAAKRLEARTAASRTTDRALARTVQLEVAP
jgi:hypothetical protein